MSRAVAEWVGKNDDTAVPDRVRLRVFAKADECCTSCTRKIRAGETWTCEHVIALINWRKTDDTPHGNRESNLGVTCSNCLAPKNAADVAEKSQVYDMRRKSVLPKKRGTWGAGRGTPWKAKIGGGVVRRERA
jgi:5-methylcytosine-specific restriction protein A